MNKKEFDNCIGELKKSSMFYMSLGSKELFHSNFLHWLSIVDWGYFLEIMHELSGQTEPFWWEGFKSEDIQVRREDKNFDLSVWVFDSENMVNRKNTKKDDEYGDSYSIKNGKQMKERWIPVLVLENKMKSLPYEEQLIDYVSKAFEIWRKGEGKSELKSEIDGLKKEYDKAWLDGYSQEWRTEHGITFILLSLLKPTNKKELEDEIPQCISYHRDKKEIKIKTTFSWKCKTYKELIDSFPKRKINPNGNLVDIDFAQKIVNDYKQFVLALYTIAEDDWRLKNEDGYLNKVCPFFSDDNDEKNKTKELVNLRIADIREKICYDQLLKLLLDELNKLKEFKNNPIKRLKKDDFITFDLENRFFCRTNYFHNIGLFEVIFMIKEKEKKKQGKEDNPFFITIQIQGNYYTHGISGKNIVIVENGKNVISNAFFADKGGYNYWKNGLKDFFDFEQKSTEIAGIPIKEKGAFYKYGSNFIYQCAEITKSLNLTISDVLNKIVEDVKWIKDNEKSLTIY